jgi:hypothetical protein
MKIKIALFFLCFGITNAYTQELITQPTTPTILPGKGLKQYDFLYAGEQKHRNMYIVKNGEIVWSYIDTLGKGEISDAVLMSNGNIVFAHQHGLSVIDKDKNFLWKLSCPKGTEIHTAQPIGKEHVVFIENSNQPKVRVVNIRTGKFVKEFAIPVKDTSRAHIQFRHARLTKRGTYLVAHMDLSKIIEYDFNGKQVLNIDFPTPWSVEELPNGNLLAVCNKNLIREITKEGKTVWELKPEDLTGYRIFGMQMAYRLPNGNTLINNWFNQWKKYKIEPQNMPAQFLEVTPDKKVVWALKEWIPPVNLGPSTIIQFLSADRAEDVRFGKIK